MDGATVGEMLETYITATLGTYGMYLVSASLGLFMLMLLLGGYRIMVRRFILGPVRGYGGVEGGFDARMVDIPPVNIPTASRPLDGSYFQTVLTFAQSKTAQGQALIPQERFILAEMAFLEKVLVSDGLTHFDSFAEGLPFKGFELRRALEEIGATDLIDVIERAVAAYLHRQQLLVDIMALGASRADALLNNRLPSYAPLIAEIDRIGGATYFVQCADAYVDRSYSWSDGSD